MRFSVGFFGAEVEGGGFSDGVERYHCSYWLAPGIVRRRPQCECECAYVRNLKLWENGG